jgi:hypothetical protein
MRDATSVPAMENDTATFFEHLMQNLRVRRDKSRSQTQPFQTQKSNEPAYLKRRERVRSEALARGECVGRVVDGDAVRDERARFVSGAHSIGRAIDRWSH